MIKTDKNERLPCYRLSVEVDVWLYKNDILFAKARLQNVSRDGMFIQTDVMLLPLDSQLRVVLEISNNSAVKQISFPVKVVHRCLDGIGVNIEQTAMQDEQSVVSLLAQITKKSYQEFESEFAA